MSLPEKSGQNLPENENEFPVPEAGTPDLDKEPALEGKLPLMDTPVPGSLAEDDSSAEAEIWDDEEPSAAGDDVNPFGENSTFGAPDPARYKKKNKNKQLRGLIAGIAAVAVLGGSIFAVMKIFPSKSEGDDTESTYSDPAIKVVTTELADIKSVSVINPEGTFKAIPYEEKASAESGSEATQMWTIEGYDKKYIDNYTTQSLVSMFASVTASREMETKGKASADFGLEAPKNQVTVEKTDGTSYTVLVGSKTPITDGVYIKLADSDKIYTADIGYYETCVQNPVAYASTTIVTAIADESNSTSSEAESDPYFANGTLTRYDRINLSGTCRDKEIKLTYSESDSMGLTTCFITAPKEADGDATKILETLLSPMASGLSAESVYELTSPAAKIKEYGLDKPLSIIYYKVKSTEVTLKIANAPDKDYYAVMVNDSPLIYKVAKTSLTFAEWQFNDLTNTLLFIKDITKVKNITVTEGGKTYSFDLEHDEEDSEALVVKANGKVISTENFRTLYADIIGVTAIEFTDKKPSGDPVTTITFKHLDTSEADIPLRFYAYSARRYQYKVFDREDILVSAEVYDKLLKMIKDFF